MNFYEQIASYYQYIFPLQESQLNFLIKNFNNIKETNLLEVGCGIGSLSFKLAELGYKITAFDLDEGMIKKALDTFHKSYSNLDNLKFMKLNMLNMLNNFNKETFNGILCFGNTLVHLNSKEDILDFFIQSKELLKNGSILLFQILNYDRIIDLKADKLPLIDNESIKFERYYIFPTKTETHIQFKTILTIKKTKKIIENCIPLIPLQSNEIKLLLRSAGYSHYKFYGTYNRDPYTYESDSIVVEVIK